jgi:hypothetical protein
MAKLKQVLSNEELQKIHMVKVNPEKEIMDLSLRELANLTYILVGENDEPEQKRLSNISQEILYERVKQIGEDL